MDPDEITGPDKAMREKMSRIEEKQARGETLTPRERGLQGAMTNMQQGAAAERAAAREGHLEEYREQHRTASWMAGEPTREPTLSADTKEEVERIRAKQAAGEKLTRSEAGILGGSSRAKE